MSKHKSWKTANSYNVDAGDLVNLYSDRDKLGVGILYYL